MLLPEQDFARLQAMQTACTQVENDARTLHAFAATLTSICTRYQTLSASYQADWQRLVDAVPLSERQQRILDGMVAEDSYSILGQDVIWNALEDVRTAIEMLRHVLALPLD